MSVEVTFQNDEISGLVAQGSTLWEAARRLGVSITAECRGRGECDSCRIAIIRGAELLAPATAAENKYLHEGDLGQGMRLACQAHLERSGQIVVRVEPPLGKSESSDAGKRFLNLPFNQKVGALVEIEALMMVEALNKIRETSRGFVGKVLNFSERKQTKSDKSESK